MVPPANVASWPMQASYAAKGDWQGLMKYNKRASEPSHSGGDQGEGRRKAAAPDDLTQLNGIGPRISTILADGGVTTYAELEHTDPSELRKIIAQGGALPPSSLDTWPTQASYAVRGDWSGPRELQQPQVAVVRLPGRRSGRVAETRQRPSRCREGPRLCRRATAWRRSEPH